MKAILLIVLLAHGGYWFGGQQNRVTLHWAAPDMPVATVSWQLLYGAVVVASGEVDMAPGAKATTIDLTMPPAKALSVYTWRYQLKNRVTGKELESGERSIYLSPGKLLEGPAKRTKGMGVTVIDGKDGELFKLLRDSGVDVTRVDSGGDLQLRQPDIILVGENQLSGNEVAQDVLRAKARQGASVMIFAQEHLRHEMGYPLRARPVKKDLVWREGHALFIHLPATAMNELAQEAGGLLQAVALPADAPVLELGSWRRETPGTDPAPIDALVATETVGKGRLVYWQIPLGDWKDDPRVQMVLANALDYLVTRPEPTLPMSQRKGGVSGKIEKIPNLVPGDKR